jgi:15,16-dihydrobiliverdin:ferredoxin oxidoreductase
MPWKTTIGQSDHPDPLLYMPFWEWQMEYMKSQLTNLEPDLTALSDFGYQENTQKKARIVSQCYKSQEYRKIRMTYYDAGDNTQVFNSVWYPDPKYNLPILGIDLLAFNRKKYLAIVDFQPLYSNEEEHAQTFSHRLAPIKGQYNSLKGQMSSKFYDETQFFSKQMLFARFEEEKVVHKDLFPAFKRYVMMHNRLLKDTRPEMDPMEQEKVLSRHVAYDTYSAERDPATGLFAAMFGKEWADDYVFDFLFSMSERKEQGMANVSFNAATGVAAASAVGKTTGSPSFSSPSSSSFSSSSFSSSPSSSSSSQRLVVASGVARQ